MHHDTRFPDKVLPTVIILSTLLSVLGNDFGLSLTAAGWVVPIVFCALYIAIHPFNHYFRFWYLWLLPIVIFTSMIITGYENSLVRFLILSCPIAVASIVGSVNASDGYIRYVRRCLSYFSVAFIFVIAIKLVLRGAEGAQFLAAESNTATFVAWFLAWEFVFSRRKRTLIVYCLVLMVPIISASRMASLASSLSLLVIFLSIRGSYKILLPLSLMLFAAVIFSSIPEKMFFDGADSGVSADNLRTSGRFLVWPVLVDGIIQEPLFGHGWNASQIDLRPEFPEFDHPHNEWLRILYDLGIVGLIAFTLPACILIMKLRRQNKAIMPSTDGAFAGLAYSFMVPLFFLTLTSNPLLHAAFFINIYFMLLGIALSRYIARQNSKRGFS